jgi:hypothetical protein
MSPSLLAAALLHLPLAAPACPIERAVYKLEGGPEFTAGFARQDRRKVHASDLVFWLKTPTRTYWFSFGSPNGYGGTYIAPDIDPRLSVRLSDEEERDAAERMHKGEDRPSIEFDAFDARLKAFESPPQSTDKAPARLFARRLGPALWYEPVSLSGGDESAAQEAMPIGLFEPAGCSGPPPEKKLRKP